MGNGVSAQQRIAEAERRVADAWEAYQQAELDLRLSLDSFDSEPDELPHEHDCAVDDETGEGCDCRGTGYGDNQNYERNAHTCVGGEGE